MLVGPYLAVEQDLSMVIFHYGVGFSDISHYLNVGCVLTHVPTHPGCYDAWQELPCCTEAGYLAEEGWDYALFADPSE